MNLLLALIVRLALAATKFADDDSGHIKKLDDDDSDHINEEKKEVEVKTAKALSERQDDVSSSETHTLENDAVDRMSDDNNSHTGPRS